MTDHERNTDGAELDGSIAGEHAARRDGAHDQRRVADGGFDPGFFEQIVAETSAAVAVYDERGRFVYVNDAFAETLGREATDLEGKPLWSVDPALDEDQFDGYWSSFDVGETRRVETVHRRADGTEIPVETHTTAIEAGGSRYHVRTVEEVGERDDERESEDERLEQFASVMSHDLRNPLNVAMGRLRLVAEECESEHVAPIENSLERMEALIDDMLTLARGGSELTDPEPVSLRETATSSWSTSATEDATLEVDDDLGTVQSDETRLRALFENLFRNAVDHGGSDVTVRVGRLDSGLYVEDDGAGIDDDVRDDVFEQGFSTTTDGTGFGLPIVEQVAEAHGWTVELADGSADGARFEFRSVEIE